MIDEVTRLDQPLDDQVRSPAIVLDEQDSHGSTREYAALWTTNFDMFSSVMTCVVSLTPQRTWRAAMPVLSRKIYNL
ncbi:hypothetical protein GCM10007884_41260 [Methylobacterium brachythecii]|uniref:Uncharacterized protein n=1 Tax=Methylobacterium brachythecii TaxID=1176177 RepID=A0ABQ6DC82_9HYPH|nr:hypothetical protein GCM10007884_41260 [Methylobacterium brachythecii]